MHISNFSKEVVKKDDMLCKNCLGEAGESYVKFKREEEEHGYMHVHH